MAAPRFSDDSDLIACQSGFVAYAWLEREAICIIEGGLSEREAMRIASLDYQRAMMASLQKAQPNLGVYPRNGYGHPLPEVRAKK